MDASTNARPHHTDQVESTYAWLRLGASLALGTIGCIGMWSFVVALPAVQADFGAARADATLPYTLLMMGFGVGGVAFGRLADRFGIMLPMLGGALALGLGYIAAGYSATLWQLAGAHGLLIGFGSSVAFGPLIADVSHWFGARRGIAVAICASGNYLAGTLWPPVVQHFIETSGWRATHIGIGLFCLATMLPISLLLRRAAPMQRDIAAGAAALEAQGGLVPAYAMFVREFFAPKEAGARLGFVLMATVVGMAFGGWMSGAIFDLTGSYQAAFANGFLWNLLNIAIVLWLLLRRARRAAYA